MQSFVTVLLAGCAACLGMFLMPATPEASDQMFALEISLEENGERFGTQRLVVAPGQSYVVDLEAGAQYDFAINIPKTDGRLVKDPFADDLANDDAAFLKFNADLTIEESNNSLSLSDYGETIASNLFLSLAEPAREFRSIIPLSGQQFFTRSGAPIETLAITIKGVPLGG